MNILNTLIGNPLLLKLLTIYLLCFTSTSYADFKIPNIDEKYIAITTEEPTRDAGYMVGDTLKRHIALTIKKPYELVTETLPIAGYEHKYQGQKTGIELLDIQHHANHHTQGTTHEIDLSYQVFTTGKLAKPAILRAEFIKIRNLKTKEVVQYRIPSFSFRISPLSVFGAVNLKEEMYPMIKPIKLDPTPHLQKRNLALGVLALALLGLLYIYGKYAWLPRMGAPFAKAYRIIHKAPDTEAGIQTAMQALHTAFNQTAGQTVFSDTLDAFLAKKKQFAPAKETIETFFDASHDTFFQTHTPQRTAQNKNSLLTICKHLRDCERGLKPNLPLQAQG